jgi:thiamine-phosphate pyrophosphorylase
LSPSPPIYPLIDTAVCAARGINPLELAEACLRGGARLLQLRDKDDSSARVTALAEQIAAAAHVVGARLIVNDRADIAKMAGADGVHVGQTDLPVEAARAIVGAECIVGVSTHDREQVDRALDSSASYIAVGPIFRTDTKETGYEPRGLELVTYAAGRGKPIVAIGGITLETASSVIDAGATAVAVVSDLLVDLPEERVREYLRRLT